MKRCLIVSLSCVTISLYFLFLRLRRFWARFSGPSKKFLALEITLEAFELAGGDAGSAVWNGFRLLKSLVLFLSLSKVVNLDGYILVPL